MARALRLCALALVLLASVAAGQVPPAGVPPAGAGAGGNAADYAAADAADATGDYAQSSGDYSPPSPDDFAPQSPPAGDTPPADDASSPSGDASSGDYAPPDPSSPDGSAPADPGAPPADPSAPAGPPGELPNTMDPATSGCRNEYHILVGSTDECTSFCDRKVDRAKGEATVDPEVYESKLGAGTCCNCNYERTPGVINPNYVPKDKGDSPPSGDNLAGGGGDGGGDSSPPAGELPSTLDPAEFKPPTEDELMAAVDPTYVYPTDPKETNTYAVLRVTGGPFTLPLPFDQVLAFIYAFNNVTGVAWQYKGDAPSVPESYPAAPFGVPPVRNGPPPGPAPSPPPPPAPVAFPPPPAAPVVDPFAGAPPPVPVDPAAVPPPAPVDPAAAVPPPAPMFDPAAGGAPPPVVDPAAVPPPAPVSFDPAAGAVSPPADPNLPGITLDGAPPAPAFRRRLRSSFRPARRLLQDGGSGNYDFSPMQGYSPPADGPAPDGNADPDNNGDNNNTNNSNGGAPNAGADPLAYGDAPPAPGEDASGAADLGTGTGDYSGGDYAPPPPDGDSSGGDYAPPPPDGSYSSPPADGGYAPPDGAYEPPPSPEVVYSPPPEAPSPPPPSPPPGLTAPPPAPPTPLPPNMDGIWYFSMYPLSDSKFLSMAVALNEATGDGSGAFLNFLTAAGVPATAVELRYIGQASEGQIDLTKRLDGDIFGASSGTAATAPADEGSSMSTATIAAIVGGVVGGVLLIAVAGILVASSRRKSGKVEKEQLSQRWATERELVEAEKVKLDASGAGGGYGGGGGSQSRINPAHSAGFVAMTNRDLDQQRSMRRAATMAAEARLSTLEPGVQASPAPEAAGVGATPKPSRLESMRSALGLSKKGSGVTKPAGSGGGGSPVPAWSDSPTGGARAAGSPSTPTLRMQYSMGGTTPTRAASGRFGGAGGGDAAGDAPSPWGRMFSKK